MNAGLILRTIDKAPTSITLIKIGKVIESEKVLIYNKKHLLTNAKTTKGSVFLVTLVQVINPPNLCRFGF